LLDKYVLDQLGADRVIRRRRMWMRRSVLADTKLTITGTVRSVDPAQGQAVIAVSCAVDGEEAVTAEVIVGDAYAAAAE
jgi:hypothetical protein